MTAYNGTDYTTSYVYDDDNRVTSVTTNGTTVEYTYDAYGRISRQVTKRGNSTILTETYTYTGTDAATSGRVATHTMTYGDFTVTYEYTYDDNGNVTCIDNGRRPIEYTYDSANQLIKENNGHLGYAWVWEYDDAGNILSKSTYYAGEESSSVLDSTAYLYNDDDWGDLLTGYTENGTSYTVSSDTSGNPISDGKRTYSWVHGRQLAALTQNNTTWTYTYNSDGLRTSRTNGTITYEYVYSGDKLVQMTVDGYTFDFTYDASGTPLTISWGNSVYYYVTNIRGDVIGIITDSGEQVVWYCYDAWGNVTIDTRFQISEYNPLLYRGYVYDFETKLYYLQSRYYDPEIGRFINADDYTITGQGLLGNNMFVYCGNNPVIRVDYGGEAWGTIAIIAAIVIGCIVAIAIDHHVAKRTDDGTAAVYDPPPSDGHKVTALYARGSGFKRDNNGFIMLDSELGVVDFEYEETQGTQNLKIDYLNLLTAEAVGQVDWSGIPSAEIGAVASVYAAKFEYSFNLLSMHITIMGDFHAGAAGLGAEFDPEAYRFKITPPQTCLLYTSPSPRD